MGKKIIRGIGVAFLIAALLVATIPADRTNAVVLDEFQMDHDSLDKYEGSKVIVTVPDDVKEIGPEAFADNQTLAQVDVGKNTKKIGHGAFANCPYLYSVVTHDNLEEIDSAAFAGDAKLSSITIGGGVSKLGYGVFAGCNNLTSINISRNNSHFVVVGNALYNSDGDMLYAYMGGAKATYFKMPNTVKNISKYCFWGNENLDSVSISSYVENIPGYAFSNCKNLKTVNIPYSVTTIDAKAFENCVSLTDVSIPASVNYIDPTAFDGCTKLNIIADPGTAAYTFFQNFDKSDINNTENGDVKTIVIPEESSSDGSGTSGNDAAPTGEGADYQESPQYEFSGNVVDAKNDPSNVEYMPTVDPLAAIDGADVIAKTVVVGGQAVLFIDPNQEVHEGVLDNPMGDTDTTVSDGTDNGEDSGQIIYDSAKGGYLPKYKTVGSKIASQAYYASQNMDDYTMTNGITDIGDFAFARSNLTSIVIPEGVTHIGYGAFYHCNNLSNVTIPSSVTEIDGYAFDNTPYISNFKSNISGDGFLTVGDGILLAYSGSNPVVNIPEGVKTIAPGVFREHKEITGVNLPSTVTVIGEDAFRDCSSLSSVTGGNNIKSIGDRAYMGCPLSSLTVPSSVQTMGLRSVDYSNTGKSDGTKVVVFESTDIPSISSGNTSRRLENDEYRKDVLYNVLFAVVPEECEQFDNTVLDKDKLGFSGLIMYKEKDSSGNETGNLIVKENYIFSEEIISSLPDTVAIAGSNYNIKDKDKITVAVNTRDEREADSNVVTLYNDTILEGITAHLSQKEEVGNLNIRPNEEGKGVLTAKYSELFGQDNTPVIAAYDITLTDSTGTVPIEKFGNSSITITMDIPGEVNGDTYHVVTLDSDGQLEEVAATIDEENNSISFNTNHLSFYGIYATDGDTSKAIIKNGNTIKNYKLDDSPNTGDFSINIRYVIVFLLVCSGLFMIFFRRRIV